jgi:hypothetical protein
MYSHKTSTQPVTTRTFVENNPALGLLFTAWTPPMIMVALTTSVFDEPVGSATFALIAACIIAAAAGIMTRGRQAASEPKPATGRVFWGLTIAGALMGLAYWLLLGNPSATLEEVRNSIHDGTFTQSQAASYLYQVGGAFTLLSIALATQARRPVNCVLASFGLGATCWAGVVLNTGGRVLLFAFLAAGVCGLLTRFTRQFFSVKGATVTLLVFVPLLLLNVVFVKYRMQSWFDHPELGVSRTQKVETLVGTHADLVLNSEVATSSLWLLLQFTSDPVYYLDYFVKYVDMAPSYGLYQFGIIGNRVPGYDWSAERAAIDTMYERIGVRTNVWGTGVRDSMIDFGAPGAVLFFFFVGVVCALTKTTSHPAGRALYIFSVMWLGYSPYNSPLTLRPVQTAIFITIAWMIASHVSRTLTLRHSTNERPYRAAVLRAHAGR